MIDAILQFEKSIEELEAMLKLLIMESLRQPKRLFQTFENALLKWLPCEL